MFTMSAFSLKNERIQSISGGKQKNNNLYMKNKTRLRTKKMSQSYVIKMTPGRNSELLQVDTTAAFHDNQRDFQSEFITKLKLLFLAFLALQ